MLVSHYRHLEFAEKQPFSRELVLRGSEERLAPILMTAVATGPAQLPFVISGNKPGHEIEHPMAMVILGGLGTSTLLNLFLMPALNLRFGSRRKPKLNLRVLLDRTTCRGKQLIRILAREEKTVGTDFTLLLLAPLKAPLLGLGQ